MKVVIVTCYESNEERVELIANTFKNRNDEVEIITTSFSHKKKHQRTKYPSFSGTLNIVDTMPYKVNLSFSRLLSHYRFAKDAFSKIVKINPGLIWVLAPCNSLVSQANKYKLNHKDTKIIIDIIDMWPESLPFSLNNDIFLLNIWKNIRSKNLKCANLLVSECNLYKKILEKEYGNKVETLYWSREGKAIDINNTKNSTLSLCYIGSINNIIDIREICNLINKLNTNIDLHIIGEGESKEKLINEAKKVCNVIYHGPIYELEKKKSIMAKCHAGLNIYKDNLYIGLTVKTMDYLQFGLPVINSIKGDTYDLIKEEKVGFNIDALFTVNDIIDLRNNNKHILDTFNKCFTKEAFTEKCNEIIDEVLE